MMTILAKLSIASSRSLSSSKEVMGRNLVIRMMVDQKGEVLRPASRLTRSKPELSSHWLISSKALAQMSTTISLKRSSANGKKALPRNLQMAILMTINSTQSWTSLPRSWTNKPCCGNKKLGANGVRYSSCLSWWIWTRHYRSRSVLWRPSREPSSYQILIQPSQGQNQGLLCHLDRMEIHPQKCQWPKASHTLWQIGSLHQESEITSQSELNNPKYRRSRALSKRKTHFRTEVILQLIIGDPHHHAMQQASLARSASPPT